MICKGTTLYMFFVQGDDDKLKTLCTDVFTKPSGNVVKCEHLGNHVMLVVGKIGWLGNDASPVGVQEDQVVLQVPVRITINNVKTLAWFSPLTIVNNPPRKAGELYDVYYNPDFIEETAPYPIFKFEGDGHEVVIPANKYFVMGDNRNNSEDSRYWGFVPRDLVIGRAMFVYWSFDESLPSNGNLLIDFFPNTRWSRTGTMVK